MADTPEIHVVQSSGGGWFALLIGDAVNHVVSGENVGQLMRRMASCLVGEYGHDQGAAEQVVAEHPQVQAAADAEQAPAETETSTDESAAADDADTAGGDTWTPPTTDPEPEPVTGMEALAEKEAELKAGPEA